MLRKSIKKIIQFVEQVMDSIPVLNIFSTSLSKTSSKNYYFSFIVELLEIGSSLLLFKKNPFYSISGELIF
jgi:hypothetical protein